MDQGTSEVLHKDTIEEERCLALCNVLILSNVLNKVNPGAVCKLLLKTLGPFENANSPNSFTTQENSPEKGTDKPNPSVLTQKIGIYENPIADLVRRRPEFLQATPQKLLPKINFFSRFTGISEIGAAFCESLVF
ncbi:hypothetical protein OROHE_000393 [Orobanche hederae]